VYELHQVKEKYGTLRYYAEPCDQHRDQEDEFDTLVDEVERQSATACENCGVDGRLCVSNHWYRTLCDACIGVEAANGRGLYAPHAPRS
jgi:hypothetical protein